MAAGDKLSVRGLNDSGYRLRLMGGELGSTHCRLLIEEMWLSQVDLQSQVANIFARKTPTKLRLLMEIAGFFESSCSLMTFPIEFADRFVEVI